MNEPGCAIADDGVNGGCNSDPPAFNPIAPGQTVCGTYAAANGRRDTDWYEFQLAALSRVTWSVTGLGPTRAYLFDPGPNGCTGYTGVATDSGPACQPVVATAYLLPGTHWAWAGTDVFQGVSCPTDYVGTLTTEPAGACEVDGTCQYATADECAALGGTYGGDGSTCSAPANDDCDAPTEIHGGFTHFSNISATTDGPEEVGCYPGQDSFGADVWFRYDAVASGTLAVSACTETGYDSMVAVYADGACPPAALSDLACDDDGCGSVGGPSQTSVSVSAGASYLIRVGGWETPGGQAGTGTGQLRLSACAVPTSTTRVNLAYTGGQASGYTTGEGATPDGRYVVMQAYSASLVPNDTNSKADIIVRDLNTGVNERVSVSSSGAQSNGDSEDGAISDDGRFVAFTSDATNLAPGGTNGLWRVYMHDRQNGTTTCIDVGPGGVEANHNAVATGISADGRFIAFSTLASNLVPNDANNALDVFLYDRVLQQLSLVSRTPAGVPGNGTSNVPSLSADGRYIVFDSLASNLVAGDTNGATDVFVYDRQTSGMTRASVSTGSAQGNASSSRAALSSDGRYVIFASGASTLVAGDTNGFYDVFVRDLQTGQTERVSVDAAGNQGNGDSSSPMLSPDGKWVAFVSTASNLVPGDTNAQADVFVRYRPTGGIERISVDSAGNQGNGQSFGRRGIVLGGHSVMFTSWSSNLVAGDTNNQPDVFLRERGGIYDVLGDLNADGAVDMADFATLQVHFGTSSGASPTDGDLDGDGDVDLIDVNLFLGAIGTGCSQGAPPL